MFNGTAAMIRAIRPSRALVAFVAAAFILPIIGSIGLFVAMDAASRGQVIETLALERAQRVSKVVDVDLERSWASMGAMATSQGVAERNWPKARLRAQVIAGLNPDWRSVTLIDAAGRTLFTTADAKEPAFTAAQLSFINPGPGVSTGGIERRSGRCTCVILGQVIAAPEGHMTLVVELDPRHFEDMLLADSPADMVTAIVDRRGNFIARSLDFDNRVGLPATHFVRDAMAQAQSGLYDGKTYEGFANRTAFKTSAATGWSTHIAVSSRLLASPRLHLWMSTMIVTVAALLFAASLAWLALRALTAQRAVEERMRAAERMEALGKLTGGIAHDFNNMLAVTIGNLDLAQRRAAKGQDPARNIETALEGARRAADLTRRMLTFSRRQNLETEVLDTQGLVEEMVGLLERTIGDHITLRTRLAEGLWPVHSDRSQLENSLVNLATNARDAMADGGVMILGAINVAGGGEVNGHRITGDHVAFFVSDSGTGMTEAVRRRALEPFFTTKDVGRGTGLGLSQIYGFVSQSGGELIIESAPGKGTTVWIVLPRSAATAMAPAQDSVISAPAETPGLDIVLAEDDERVAATTVSALEELGHVVRVAPNGAEALKLVETAVPDLLISDILMPVMNGNQLVEAVRRQYPGLPVLFISAYNPDSAETANSPGVPLLRKPYSMDSLQAAIARLNVTPRALR